MAAASTPHAPTLLSALEPFIVQGRGARFEADVFCILFQDRRVIRAFEFAPVDGVLDCSADPIAPPDAQYAYRFWKLNEDLKMNRGSRLLVPFDIKSTTAYSAGKQHFISTNSQMGQVAFYIAICAADTRFIEVIPNMQRGAASPEDPKKPVAVNLSRKQFLDGPSYGNLDPCGAPYRMPLSLLPEAMRRVRRCAVAGTDYANPWTGVSFPRWRPITVQTGNALRPAEGTEHFSAYLGTMAIYGALMHPYPQGRGVTLDFVWLMPRLADFKIVVNSRQLLVQYKIDAKDRAQSNLAQVAIARGAEQERRFYFSSHDRFDFLFYEFNFSNRPRPAPIKEIFVLPERVLPDLFYTSLDLETSFDIAEFQQYRVQMDGDWIRRVCHILEGETQPRQACRPVRDREFSTQTARAVAAALRPNSTPDDAPDESIKKARGLEQLGAFTRRFFSGVMDQCMARSSGLLFVLASEHPEGSFGFCRYQWTRHEREVYAQTSRPPRVLHELPAATPAVSVYTFARSVESSSRGPKLSSAEFRRVNSSRASRLLVFDPMGPEGFDGGPLFAVPSDDLSPTLDQLQLYRDNADKDKHMGEHETRVPLVASLLHSGRAITDYVVCSSGPLVYDERERWNSMWELLHHFSATDTFEYPTTILRQPANYHKSVQQLHESLVESFSR